MLSFRMRKKYTSTFKMFFDKFDLINGISKVAFMFQNIFCYCVKYLKTSLSKLLSAVFYVDSTLLTLSKQVIINLLTLFIVRLGKYPFTTKCVYSPRIFSRKSSMSRRFDPSPCSKMLNPRLQVIRTPAISLFDNSNGHN